MPEYAELEISLYPCYKGLPNTYQMELHSPRFADHPPIFQVQFDISELAKCSEGAEYGQVLKQALFKEVSLRNTFSEIYNQTISKKKSLHLRLFIAPSIKELHHICWEALIDPESNSFLLTNKYLLFSRYLGSFDWQVVSLRPQVKPRALLVVANPTDLSNYNFPTVKVTEGLAWSEQDLGNLSCTTLAPGENATLDNISTELHKGTDVFYLACFGKIENNKPYLWLENAQGATARIDGNVIISKLKHVQQGPRLVILNIHHDENAPSNIAPILASDLTASGIPAVVVMQGNISHKTLGTFMPCFFRELAQDGQVDRAMALARHVTRKKPDCWVPALFLRFKSGRIWYTPGFAEEKDDTWQKVVPTIRLGSCVPILGPGLSDSITGSYKELARELATIHHYPLTCYGQENLAPIAQYISTTCGDSGLKIHFIEHLLLKLGISKLMNSEPPTSTQPTNSISVGDKISELDQLISERGRTRWENEPNNPYRILAELPFSLYLTANINNLLAQALLFSRKQPKIKICGWNEPTGSGRNSCQEIEAKLNQQFMVKTLTKDLERRQKDTLPGSPEEAELKAQIRKWQALQVQDESSGYERPTPQKPLIFHFFGHLQYPDALVLTEDHYFKYLINITQDHELIPPLIAHALVDNTLLFLGFQWDAWDFRVLLQSIMHLGGKKRMKNFPHVAVQIDPEESRILEPEKARRYLQTYFENLQFSIYWGRVDDFLQDLKTHLANP